MGREIDDGMGWDGIGWDIVCMYTHASEQVGLIQGFTRYYKEVFLSITWE